MSYPLLGIGDRVSRLTYMDDGTWAREGDSCLVNSPKRHGIVVRINIETESLLLLEPLARKRYRELLYVVQWDGEHGMHSYFRHGVELEEVVEQKKGKLMVASTHGIECIEAYEDCIERIAEWDTSFFTEPYTANISTDVRYFRNMAREVLNKHKAQRKR